MLSVEQRKQYQNDGFLLVRGVLPVESLERINADIARLFETQLRHLGLPIEERADRAAFYENAKRLIRADVPRYIATARTAQELPSVAKLLASDALVDLARAFGIAFPVSPTKPSVHIMADDLKVPGGYHKTPPHQEWRSVQGSLDGIVIWIPTTPVRANSHALEVVPGSHRYGLLETVEHIMTPTVSDRRISEDSFLAVPADPGDVIVFSAFTVHRTGEEGDGFVRIALNTRFNNALEATFVERGYLTPYKYSYRLDLMTPDFPSAETVEAVFLRD
jgi:phytanoyl-CoA hydroxylase